MSNMNSLSRIDPFPTQIANLDIGESVVKAQRFDLDTLNRATLTDARQRFRNTGSAAIGRAKAKANHGAKFLMEVGEFTTTSHDVVLCLVVTRTA
jgi:hypothetical protein